MRHCTTLQITSPPADVVSQVVSCDPLCCLRRRDVLDLSFFLRLKGNYSTLPQQLSLCFRDHSPSFCDGDFPNKASGGFCDRTFQALLPQPQCEDYLEIYRSKCPSRYKIKSSFFHVYMPRIHHPSRHQHAQIWMNPGRGNIDFRDFSSSDLPVHFYQLAGFTILSVTLAMSAKAI